MIAKIFTFILTLVLSFFANAQTNLPTDYLKPEFHKGRRTALREKMPKNSVAIFMANPVQNRSNDVDFIYHPDPNFYYLSGYKEPNGLLIIFSEKQLIDGELVDEILFVQERNPFLEQWNGYRLGKEGAKSKLKFSTVFEAKEFFNFNLDFRTFDKVMINYPNGEYTNNKSNSADSFKINQSLKQKIGTAVNDSNALMNIMTELRQIKLPEEIELLKKAAKISAIGQIEVMKAMHPKMSETEIQGIHEFIYKKYGSEYEGYNSIVGAGANGCILHYVENNKTKVGDDLVLMDLGAEYHGYTADVTRTIPANGKFSDAQKTIYNLVLKAQKAGIEKAIIGSSLSEIDKASREVINKGLMDLGIVKNEKEARQYFAHSTGHYLGLNVHDLGDYKDLKANMVITVEPGIYIPTNAKCDPKFRGIAIRIEDDIWITEQGPINLSIDAPREIKDIEEMMKKPSVLKNYNLPKID